MWNKWTIFVTTFGWHEMMRKYLFPWQICAKYEKENNRCALERGTTLTSSWNHFIFAKILFFSWKRKFSIFTTSKFSRRRYLGRFCQNRHKFATFFALETSPASWRRHTRQPLSKGEEILLREKVGLWQASPKIYNQLQDRDIYPSNKFVVLYAVTAQLRLVSDSQFRGF